MSKVKELKRERRAAPPVNGNGHAPAPVVPQMAAPPRAAFTLLITFDPAVPESERVRTNLTPVGGGMPYIEDVLHALQTARDAFLIDRAAELARQRFERTAAAPPAPVEGGADV